MWIASGCTLRDPKFLGGIPQRCASYAAYVMKISCFAASTLIHNAYTISWLTKPKDLQPPLTHSSPSQHKLVPVSKNLRQLLVFLQQKTAEERAHIQELKKYHLQLQQVCDVCVYV